MPKKPSSWSLLASMIDRPGVALANIVGNPRWRWVLPVMLAVLTTAAAAALTAPLLADQAKLAIAGQLNRLPAEQLAQIQTQMALFQSPVFVGGTAALTGILTLLLGWLLGELCCISAHCFQVAMLNSDASSLPPPGWVCPSCWSLSWRLSTP